MSFRRVHPRDHGMVRCLWIVGKWYRNGGFTRGEYEQRFGVGLRTFRRDLETLREAGFRWDVPMGRPTPGQQYRLLCFVASPEAA